MIARAATTRYGDNGEHFAPAEKPCATVEDVDRLVQRITERDFAAFEARLHAAGDGIMTAEATPLS
jgi:hypothetical protein